MKTIFRILVIFLLLTSSCLAYELGDKFNENDFTEYLNLGDNKIAYTLNNDTLNFYGIEVDQINYIFYKDRLYAKFFIFSIKNPEVSLDKILNVLEYYYGKPTTKNIKLGSYYYLSKDSLGILTLNKEFKQYEFIIADNKMMLEFHSESKK